MGPFAAEPRAQLVLNMCIYSIPPTPYDGRWDSGKAPGEGNYIPDARPWYKLLTTEELKDGLRQCLVDENYETACKLRDELATRA